MVWSFEIRATYYTIIPHRIFQCTGLQWSPAGLKTENRTDEILQTSTLEIQERASNFPHTFSLNHWQTEVPCLRWESQKPVKDIFWRSEQRTHPQQRQGHDIWTLRKDVTVEVTRSRKVLCLQYSREGFAKGVRHQKELRYHTHFLKWRKLGHLETLGKY